MQKIFYIHVPLAIVALVGWTAAEGVMAIIAPAHARRRLGRALLRDHPHGRHLRRRGARNRLDLGEGQLGKWWVWDEPTLVSFLIVFLLYATYYPLRYSIEDPRPPGALLSVSR